MDKKVKMKMKMKMLLGKLELEPSFASDVVTACAILHNICQERREPLDETLLDLHTQDNSNIHDTGPSSNEVRNHLLACLEENSMNETLR